MGKNKLPIPIKNIFYMLCYAWNVLAIKDDILVGDDDFDDAYNLLGRIFAYGTSKLIKSGFHRSYIENEDDLLSLRGKINMNNQIKNIVKRNGQCSCVYDEYSTNDIFNQIIKYTMNSLIKNPLVDANIKKTLHNQIIFFSNIDEIPPTKDNRIKLVFNRNNTIYRLLINIAIMIYDNTIVNDEKGKNVFKDFFREEQMQRVYELFLLNFYKINLDNKVYHVHAPKINWRMDKTYEDIELNDLFDIDWNPGDRRTDIVIENNNINCQFILDAKYYAKTFINKYMTNDETKIRDSHMNQIKGYVNDSDYNGFKYGALLYPMTTNDLSKGKMIPFDGTPIYLKTINLNSDWKNIERDLLGFLSKLEEVHNRYKNSLQ